MYKPIIMPYQNIYPKIDSDAFLQDQLFANQGAVG